MLYNRIAAWLMFNCIHIYNYLSTRGSVLVEIDKGLLRGYNATTWRGTRYFGFKGIPYAKPPVEEFRFKAPREETAWVGIRDATTHGEVCPQLDMFYRVYRGEEDCLFLNVYTPAIRGGELLPVMFLIHGGMFVLGSGNDEIYGPDYFMDAGNVVVVTINYRLGALGLLSTGDDAVPGNAGMKDQVAALKWVRRNVASFGGDPTSVTLFGGSTGAACVHYHLLSPMSRGLFTGAISQSGSSLNPWSLSSVNGPEVTVRLAEALGAGDLAGNVSGALEFLENATPRDIVEVQGRMITAAQENAYIEFLFTPSVESGSSSPGENFLPDFPVKLLEAGNFNKVPYISGYNSDEGYFFIHDLEKPEMMRAVMKDTENFLPSDIRNKRTRKSLAESIRKFYFDDQPIGSENVSNLIDYYSDSVFLAGMERAAKLYVKAADTPNYFYVFSYDDYTNLKTIFDIHHPGAVHADELGYLFHYRLRFWKKPATGSRNEEMIDRMVGLWTNFAKYGNPTPAGDPLDWKPVTMGKFHYLDISGPEMEVREDPHPRRTDFWEKAYEASSASNIVTRFEGDSDTVTNRTDDQLGRPINQRIPDDL